MFVINTGGQSETGTGTVFILTECILPASEIGSSDHWFKSCLTFSNAGSLLHLSTTLYLHVTRVIEFVLVNIELFFLFYYFPKFRWNVQGRGDGCVRFRNIKQNKVICIHDNLWM